MENLGHEDEHREFKNNTTELEDGIVSLSAMLNKSCHGEVLFGVRDDGDVVGMDIGKTTLKKISETVIRSMDPPVLPVLEIRESSDGKEYISMSAKGNDRPYLVKGIAYIRCGEENRRASQHELKMMLRSSDDHLAESLSRNQDLSFTELCLILKGKGIDMADDTRLHHSFDLLNSEGRFNIQAELLSDQNISPLTVFIFSGLDRTTLTYRTDYSGQSLLTEMKGVLDFMRSINERYVVVSSGERTEQDLFDYEAFKEAWVNACVHNNWLSMIPPAVYVFDDRLEVVSYGSKPYWLTDEDFFKGRSMPVNESLMRTFIQTRISEHSGHGIPVIVNAYGKDAFDFSSGQVVVTIRFSRSRIASTFRESRSGLTENELRVFDAIRTYPTKNQKELSKMTGLSEGHVIKTVVKLRKMGLIERKGSRKAGYWSVDVTNSTAL